MRRRNLQILAVGLLWLAFAVGGAAQQPREHWVATWATADTWRPAAVPVAPAAPSLAPQASAPPTPRAAPAVIQARNQTLRQIVHTSIGGRRVRVVLSNVFGMLPLDLGGASLALHGEGASIVAGSAHPLTFSGWPVATISAGAILVSDPVVFAVPPMADLVIDVFLPGETANWASPLTVHPTAATTNYLSTSGNHVGEVSLPVASTLAAWWLLGRVDVVAPASTRAIVTFGDSITDGLRSTVDTNSRWPDVLSRRLHARQTPVPFGIINTAITGNQLLHEGAATFGINALARFDRDVLAQPGAAYVVVLEGINDLGMGRLEDRPSAEEVIAAYKQLIERAHTHGLTIYGATLTPFEGADYFSAVGEMKRQVVHEWIRTSKAFDAVIDFDKVTRDPANPTKFLPVYDSGDHLHPNDAGYRAMGQSIDLALFK